MLRKVQYVVCHRISGERRGWWYFRLAVLVCATCTALTCFMLHRSDDNKESSPPVDLHGESVMYRQEKQDVFKAKGSAEYPATINMLHSKKKSGVFRPEETKMHQSEILRKRLDRVRKQCSHMHMPKRDVALYPPESLIVNEEHRIIYCNVPKVGCTSWKNIFLKIGGFDRMANHSAIKHIGPNAQGRIYLDYIHKYTNISHRRFLLQNYTKFMFVRHPFSRILSAFRSKLAPDISFYFRYHDEKARWVSNYGRKIIEKYRGEEEAKRVSSNYTKEYDLTFAEFIRFLVDPETDSFNKHWSEMHSMCFPCDLDYDVIGNYETIHEDSEYILRLAGIDPSITFPTPAPGTVTNSSDPTMIEKYYRNIAKPLLRRLFEVNSVDFQLFGYDAQPFLNF